MTTHLSILAWKIHRWRSLAGYSSCGCKESDTIEHTAYPQIHVTISSCLNTGKLYSTNGNKFLVSWASTVFSKPCRKENEKAVLPVIHSSSQGLLLRGETVWTMRCEWFHISLFTLWYFTFSQGMYSCLPWLLNSSEQLRSLLPCEWMIHF